MDARLCGHDIIYAEKASRETGRSALFPDGQRRDTAAKTTSGFVDINRLEIALDDGGLDAAVFLANGEGRNSAARGRLVDINRLKVALDRRDRAGTISSPMAKVVAVGCS